MKTIEELKNEIKNFQAAVDDRLESIEEDTSEAELLSEASEYAGQALSALESI